MANCPRCGLDLPKGSIKFCPECGYNFQATHQAPPPLPIPIKEKQKPRKKPSVLMGCLGFFVVMIFLSAIFGSRDSKPKGQFQVVRDNPPLKENRGHEKAPPPLVSTTPKPTATPKPHVTPLPRWRVLGYWQGSSNKNTEDFLISSNQWRIQWKTRSNEPQYAAFSSWIYDANTGSHDFRQIEGLGPDVSYFRGAGRYYLKINQANLTGWWIQVEEFR